MANQGIGWLLLRPRACVAAGAIIALAVLILVRAWGLHAKSAIPPVVVLPAGFVIPPQTVPVPDRWMPRSWGWLWRIKESVLGKAKGINLEVAAFELDPVVFGMQFSADAGLAQLLNPSEQFYSNGVKVWLLPNGRIRDLKMRFSGTAGSRSRLQARVMTGDNILSGVSTSDILGLSHATANLLPLVHRDSTELTMVLQSTAPASATSRTNLSAAVRVRLPLGTGFILLDAQGSKESLAAILVTAERPASKPAATASASTAGGAR